MDINQALFIKNLTAKVETIKGYLKNSPFKSLDELAESSDVAVREIAKLAISGDMLIKLFLEGTYKINETYPLALKNLAHLNTLLEQGDPSHIHSRAYNTWGLIRDTVNEMKDTEKKAQFAALRLQTIQE